MNIGIDTHAAEHEASGNSTYVRGLVETLVSIVEPHHRLFLYATDAGHPWYRPLRGRPGVTVRALRPASALGRLLLSMPLASLRDRLDLLHVQYVGPLLHRGALVLTVHDVAFESHGATFPALLRTRLRWQVPREIARAALLLTGSAAAAADIAAAYGLEPDRFVVVPYGIDARFGPARAAPATSALLARCAIHAPFVLSVGRLNPRKNLAGVLAAFEMLRADRPGPLQLVIVGEDDYGGSRLREAVAASSARSDVVLTGAVDADDLALLYAAASVFVYPSFYEGFGLPPLEAMASGTPVVASTRGALAEVLGDAALQVDPESPAAIAAGLAAVLDDAGLARRLSAAGLARASRFSWQACAKATMAAYEQAFAQRQQQRR